MELLLIVLLTLVNGVFASSEMALASSRKARLAAMSEAGDFGAEAALRLLEEPTTFLSTVQVGITSIGVLNGIVGEAAFSAKTSVHLQAWGLTQGVADVIATAVVVTLITFVTIIFGELVPKRIAQLYPESVSRVVARPMAWLAKVASPFVKLLAGTTAAVLTLLRIDSSKSRMVTEEEISASLEEGVDAGVIEEHEHQMVRNVFLLDDRPLTSLMTPRSDIEWFDSTCTVRQCLAQVGAAGQAGHDRATHSWYPVCRGSLDDVVGVVSVAQLLGLGGDFPESVESIAMPAQFAPETLSGMELLEQFRSRSGRLVFVVDEYGVVQGLLTPKDLLEAITGELQPILQADAWATYRADGVWVLNGLMPISELKVRLSLDVLPDEDRGLYNTLGGFLMFMSGHLPKLGDKLEHESWVFEVVELEGRRVEKVWAFKQTSQH